MNRFKYVSILIHIFTGWQGEEAAGAQRCDADDAWLHVLIQDAEDELFGSYVI